MKTLTAAPTDLDRWLCIQAADGADAGLQTNVTTNVPYDVYIGNNTFGEPAQ